MNAVMKKSVGSLVSSARPQTIGACLERIQKKSEYLWRAGELPPARLSIYAAGEAEVEGWEAFLEEIAQGHGLNGALCFSLSRLVEVLRILRGPPPVTAGESRAEDAEIYRTKK
jgi:hypothetical protein